MAPPEPFPSSPLRSSPLPSSPSPSAEAFAFAAALAAFLPRRIVILFADDTGAACGLAAPSVSGEPTVVMAEAVARFRRMRPTATVAAAYVPTSTAR